MNPHLRLRRAAKALVNASIKGHQNDTLDELKADMDRTIPKWEAAVSQPIDQDNARNIVLGKNIKKKMTMWQQDLVFIAATLGLGLENNSEVERARVGFNSIRYFDYAVNTLIRSAIYTRKQLNRIIVADRADSTERTPGWYVIDQITRDRKSWRPLMQSRERVPFQETSPYDVAETAKQYSSAKLDVILRMYQYGKSPASYRYYYHGLSFTADEIANIMKKKDWSSRSPE